MNIFDYLFGKNSAWCKFTHWCWHEKPKPVPVPVPPPVPPTPPMPPTPPKPAKSFAPPLIGLSHYQVIKAAWLDMKKVDNFFRLCDESGACLTEFFASLGWAKVQRVLANEKTILAAPSIYNVVDTWQAHGQNWPLYDWTIPAEITRGYWKVIAEKCKTYDLIPIVKIMDGKSWKGDNKRDYVWCSAKQIHEDHGGPVTGGLNGDPIIPWYREDAKFWIQTFGLDAYYCPANEYGPADPKKKTDPDYPEWEKKQIAGAVRFHRTWVTILTALGVPLDHIICSTLMGFDAVKAALPACLHEVHGINSPEKLKWLIEEHGTQNVIPNGDGPDKNAKGVKELTEDTWEPSVEQAREMRPMLIANGFKQYCTFSRAAETVSPADLALAEKSMPMLRALTGHEVG